MKKKSPLAREANAKCKSCAQARVIRTGYLQVHNVTTERTVREFRHRGLLLQQFGWRQSVIQKKECSSVLTVLGRKRPSSNQEQAEIDSLQARNIFYKLEFATDNPEERMKTRTTQYHYPLVLSFCFKNKLKKNKEKTQQEANKFEVSG